jgi:hypothetical protein
MEQLFQDKAVVKRSTSHNANFKEIPKPRRTDLDEASNKVHPTLTNGAKATIKATASIAT